MLAILMSFCLFSVSQSIENLTLHCSRINDEIRFEIIDNMHEVYVFRCALDAASLSTEISVASTMT